MIDYIGKREVSSQCGEELRLCKERAACHVPHVLRERELSIGSSSCDKVFAAAWIDDANVALGTKDNKLLLVHSQKDRCVEITLPRRNSWSRPEPVDSSCGIHSISLNLSKSLLVTGADHPNDAAVFRLPSFQPLQLLKKHDDWIFATSWLTDTVLATGSRDSTVKLWSVTRSRSYLNESPIAERRYHRDKVRDIKYCSQAEILGTLSQDGTCKIWDPHVMEVISTVQLHYRRHLQCLAIQYPVLAVGSQKHVSFIDMRCGHLTKHIESLDDAWGVRSLSLRGPLLTCGGGKGRLSFFEMRAMKYLTLDPDASGNKHLYYKIGRGAPAERDFKWHAVYAHSYDVTGTSLLAVGGPALYGQKGCYTAIW
ncbi:DDB1- and CUL4-associated factor 12-A-like [Selaginella moellendorffii]|uniref:DDB1- and CUL4-associated factor 12-A-like n=1 Tax=Selaginella moellendorffii TaxID=88036 RepID=UPI000D1C8EE7|nr:DDB1- and CUL4-associated factor 12-A-like [Selaginella moellendorffii]|eukprot:XP_024528618.1 DDB1- and CUL4-associated factor 12-A-like [Selaginella moellendorffii]